MMLVQANTNPLGNAVHWKHALLLGTGEKSTQAHPIFVLPSIGARHALHGEKAGKSTTVHISTERDRC